MMNRRFKIFIRPNILPIYLFFPFLAYSNCECHCINPNLYVLCLGEDNVIVQVRIDEVQKQLSDLKNKVDDSLEQMEEALPLAQRVEEAHGGLMGWLAEVEPRLRGRDTGGDAEGEVQVCKIQNCNVTLVKISSIIIDNFSFLRYGKILKRLITDYLVYD